MHIRTFDYLPEYRESRREILAAIEGVLESGSLILGNELQRFEHGFAEFLGAQGRCVGVNSGTDALAIALRALGIGLGDEVVTVANTAVPTVSAIRQLGAIPVFCDVSVDTALMDLNALPACITTRTRAIVPVHLYGNVVDVPRIRKLITNRNIVIVEDCAQAHGATLRGQMAGRMGDAAAFSFYPTKNLGAYGDAGMCFSLDVALVKEMRSIRTYGYDASCRASREGINSRMDEIQAAILNVKLPHLPECLRRRRSLAARYHAAISRSIKEIEPENGVEHAYHLFVIDVPERERVRTRLRHAGIETAIHYPTPIHLMPAYAFLGYCEGSLPGTEYLASRVLSLPLYPALAETDVDRICNSLVKALR